MAVAGTLMIRMAADVAELKSGMAQAMGAVEKMQAQLGKLGLAIGLEEIVRRTTTAILDAASAAADLAEEAENIGVGTDALQAWRAAALEAGVETAALDAAVQKFSVNIGKAAEGSKTQIEAFDRLGVKMLDAQNQLRPTEELLQEVAAAILAIEDPARRAAAMVEVFGKSGQKMQSTLKDLASTSAEVQAFRAQGAGLVVSAEDIAILDQASDALGRLGQQFKVWAAGFAADVVRYWDEIKKDWNDLPAIFGGVYDRLAVVFADLVLLGVSAFVDIQKAVINAVKGIGDAINAMSEKINAWYQNDAPGWLQAMLGGGTITGKIIIDIEPRGMEALERITQWRNRLQAQAQASGQALEDLAFLRGLERNEIPEPVPGVRPRTTGARSPTPTPTGGGGRRQRDEELERQLRLFDATERYNRELAKTVDRYESMAIPSSRILDQITELNALHQAGAIHTEIYNKAMEKLMDTWSRAKIIEDYGKGMANLLDGLENQFKQLGDTIFDVFTGAEFNLREFATTFIKEIGRMVFQMLVWTPIIEAFMTLIRGWMGGTPAGPVTVGGVPFPPPGGQRAAGGTVYPGQSYMVGEFGRERFVPSTPGRIEPQANGGGDTVVNISISGVESGSGNRRDEAAELARRLRGAVLDVMRNEKRPGGMLAQGA